MPLFKMLGWIRMNTAKKYAMRHSPCYTYDISIPLYVVTRDKHRAIYLVEEVILPKTLKRLLRKYPLGGQILKGKTWVNWDGKCPPAYDDNGRRL
jgi:hypothetical protein